LNLLSANLWIEDMVLFAEMNSVWNAGSIQRTRQRAPASKQIW